ncbi:hypothetical protein ACTQ45_01015 [Fundicoccus sp. Sow4_D5]|uniref:hypothetical protein n=1 Tax=Fundicoccus sp. Sow4_D5 TaxID=3438782 RepID=UPI003F8F6A0B
MTIIKNESPVKMTMQDLLKLWIPLRPTETELTHETSHKPSGGDQDDNPYLLEVTNGKTI